MVNSIDQLRSLVEKDGTPDEINTYIAEHFEEFPEEVQKKLSVLLFREALHDKLRQQEAMIELKKQAVEIIDALEAADK